MNVNERVEAVRSNAQYLRNVRPIDPEEICEYIDGAPHPAVVRQDLREQAADLELLERDDGTFVPVEDEPVPPRREPVTRFPEAYEQRIESFLADRYGPNWADGAAGDLLRSTIRRFKAQYLEGAPVEYDEDVAAGYAIYHLPGYYAATQYTIEELADRGLLGRNLRVLDIGAGVGGPALGLADYLPEDALLEYHAVEPSDAADVLEELLEETGRNVHPTVHRTTIETFDPAAASSDTFDPTRPDDGFDLVLVANVLSELEDPETVLRSALELTAPDGAVAAIAPADKQTSIQLRDLERTVEDDSIATGNTLEWSSDTGSAPNGNSAADAESAAEAESTPDAEPDRDSGGDSDTITVYSPSVRLWDGERPTDRGWSFDVRPDLEVPSFQRRLEDAADETDDAYAPGEFVNVDVQFSHSIFRRDGKRRIDLTLDSGSWAKMAKMDRHVPNRIDLVAAKMSHSLGDDDAPRSNNPLFKISDGSEHVDHYAVLTRETAMNRALVEAEYGEVCSFDGALALWNDDEGAYNLVVDEETIVDRLV
ncbi:class I SAM-dependent methyltransferase [Halostagnicola sp. A-GB9-2]|uniref:small ribosomal subunit Rsm22 family protein n=1 Tax=Halostagnicola sp. A-GB9-2 TaxID=3048066 RepID=UPI0024BF8CB2|nr:class I SAM-dependent methyltransferase [Halostagnicola sp. A-GB9-2]MDJ1430712.1 class I SAM-dependent methyltransferase [Halostagnicola sp. A-GB9-2]